MKLLELLKTRGKALIIRGPQGCGKGLLAGDLIGGCDRAAHTVIEVLQGRGSKFTPWLDGSPQVVIVEGFPENEEEVRDLKALVTGPELLHEMKGKDAHLVPAPLFIFCTASKDPLQVGAGDRRFMVLDMDSVL